MDTIFNRLNGVNVNEHVEKKNGLSYLSWAWAWAEVKKAYPTANYTIYERPDGVIYWTDGKTAWVKTGVTIEGLEHIEYLPIMDMRNRSIPLENITSFDVNKAIQRSLTKAAARHGLGLYIYAGEDLPEGEQPEAQPAPAPQQATIAQIQTIQNLCSAEQLAKMHERYGEDFSRLTRETAGKLLHRLRHPEEASA